MTATADATAAPQDASEAASVTADAQPEQPKRPSVVKFLARHRAVWMPWGWMATADIAAATAHYAAPDPLHAFLTAAAVSTTASGWALWRSREGRLTQRIKTLKTRRRVQANVQRAVMAGSVWELVAATWTPSGPHHLMQIALLGGGHILAIPHWLRIRRKPDAVTPIAEITAPAEDKRLVKFRDHLCQSGALQDAHLHSFTIIPGGFRFELTLSLARGGTFRHLKAREDDIAALYDVPFDHVSVEPPQGNRSARRAVITVLTETNAHQREEAWDGRSTYDPNTGCFELGRFADTSRSHWQLHKPGSGACFGAVIGVQGSGKTGTLHVIACEAGQAKLCAECGPARTCITCRMERFCAVWLGDAQRQPFGVWRGHADLTAWGPLASVRMLSWAHAAMRVRSDAMGRMRWTDHLGRTNVGKGWFDPYPGFPQILLIIDEWPIILNDPELAPYALPMAEQIGDEGRKVGVSLILGLQDSDVNGELGSRGLRNALSANNGLSHLSDKYAKRMLGLEGNPADLPPGVPGAGYLRGFDDRSGIVQRTKSIREYLRPGQTGVDVRGIAERIAQDPVLYDPAVLQTIAALGYTGPGQVLDDEDGWDLSALHPSEEPAQEETSSGDHEGAPAKGTSAPPQDIEAASQVLGERVVDEYDVMQATGMSGLETRRALDALVTAGRAVREPSGLYAARL